MDKVEAYMYLERLKDLAKSGNMGSDGSAEKFKEALDMAACALGAIDQIRWECDVAVDQLGRLGYGLGEKT